MELRPGFEDFAGIPQETRLLFAILCQMENIEATGLINHPSRRLWPGLSRGFFAKWQRLDRRIFTLSKFAISAKVDPYRSVLDRLTAWYLRRTEVAKLLWLTFLGVSYRTYDFDARLFGDFV